MPLHGRPLCLIPLHFCLTPSDIIVTKSVWCSGNSPVFHSFIHSGHFYSTPSSPIPLSGAPDYSTDTVSEFHAEAQATAGKGLAQGPYVTARAGIEPTTLRLRVIASTNAPSRPIMANKNFCNQVTEKEIYIYIYTYIYTRSQKKLCKIVSVRTLSNFHQL